jgi:hypothetical protein
MAGDDNKDNKKKKRPMNEQERAKNAERSRLWREKNPEYARNWKANNPPNAYQKAKQAEYNRNKRATLPPEKKDEIRRKDREHKASKVTQADQKAKKAESERKWRANNQAKLAEYARNKRAKRAAEAAQNTKKHDNMKTIVEAAIKTPPYVSMPSKNERNSQSDSNSVDSFIDDLSKVASVESSSSDKSYADKNLAVSDTPAQAGIRNEVPARANYSKANSSIDMDNASLFSDLGDEAGLTFQAKAPKRSADSSLIGRDIKVRRKTEKGTHLERLNSSRSTSPDGKPKAI